MRERLLRHRWIAALKPSAQRAAKTAAPVRFLLSEILRPGRIGTYRVREARTVRFALRHGTPDAETFDQVFCQGAHEPPDEAAAVIDALARPPRVLDLGANVGLSAAWIVTRWPGATVTCVEPDPGNTEVLREAARANGGAWRIVEAAAGSAPGELRFRTGGYSVSRAALAGEEGPEVVAVPVIDALELAGDQDVLKIDIEGGEWEILADARMADLPVVALALEYHPHLCPERNTHAHARTLLEAAGFLVRRVPHVYGAPPDDGSLWAWRSAA